VTAIQQRRRVAGMAVGIVAAAGVLAIKLLS